MVIKHLSLTHFRNYNRLELNFSDGPTLLHGANAQGKTNLLEAIYYLATTRSPYADGDKQLINWSALLDDEPIIASRLTAQLETRDGPIQIELRLIQEQRGKRLSFRREALLNRRKIRLLELLGNLRVILFLPEDVQIITGSPSKRRRYLDITLCQTDPAYCRYLSTYNKTLEQRNALLRRLAEGGSGRDLLPVYTEKLVDTGSRVFLKRAAFIAVLDRQAQRIHYEQLTDGSETLKLDYLPRLGKNSVTRGTESAIEEAVNRAEWLKEQEDHNSVAQLFQQVLNEVEDTDIASGMTRIGPHRDDWRFLVNGRRLSNYGSRGQQRSAILAMKLAEIKWMTSVTGDSPILLLDEVVAELDEQRRQLLLESVMEVNQAILTATDPNMLTEDFLANSTSMTVSNGQVFPDQKEPSSSGLATDIG